MSPITVNFTPAGHSTYIFELKIGPVTLTGLVYEQELAQITPTLKAMLAAGDLHEAVKRLHSVVCDLAGATAEDYEAVRLADAALAKAEAQAANMPTTNSQILMEESQATNG